MMMAAAMSNHIESGDIDIADGDQFMSISRFIPDFKNQTGTVDITIKTRPLSFWLHKQVTWSI